MPNTPVSMQLPPPTTKGTTSEATMLKTFPDINVTVQGMATVWLLSKQSTDFVSKSSSILILSQSRPLPNWLQICYWSLQVALGQYPEKHFSEEIPRKFIKDFQADLQLLSDEIKKRNVNLEIPYTYIDPANLENSVAIWASWNWSPILDLYVHENNNNYML